MGVDTGTASARRDITNDQSIAAVVTFIRNLTRTYLYLPMGIDVDSAVLCRRRGAGLVGSRCFAMASYCGDRVVVDVFFNCHLLCANKISTLVDFHDRRVCYCAFDIAARVRRNSMSAGSPGKITKQIMKIERLFFMNGIFPKKYPA